MFNSFYILKSFLEDYERIKELVKKNDLKEAEKIAERWGLTVITYNEDNKKDNKKTDFYLMPIEWDYNDDNRPKKDGLLIK